MSDVDSVERQAIVDTEHLRLLSIFYYVKGGFTACYALLPLIYVAMGVMVIVMSSLAAAADEEAIVGVFMGWFFVVFGGMFTCLGLLIGGLDIYAGRCIAQRKSRILCLVVAGISCLAVPYGTVLGVLTFMTLLRESVATQFATSAARRQPDARG